MATIFSYRSLTMNELQVILLKYGWVRSAVFDTGQNPEYPGNAATQMCLTVTSKYDNLIQIFEDRDAYSNPRFVVAGGEAHLNFLQEIFENHQLFSK